MVAIMQVALLFYLCFLSCVPLWEHLSCTKDLSVQSLGHTTSLPAPETRSLYLQFL